MNPLFYKQTIDIFLCCYIHKPLNGSFERLSSFEKFHPFDVASIVSSQIEYHVTAHECNQERIVAVTARGRISVVFDNYIALLSEGVSAL